MATTPKFPELAGLTADELRGLVAELLVTVAKLEGQVAALSDENAGLKGLKGRLQVKPSGMEKGTDSGAAGVPDAPKPPARQRRRRGGKKAPKSARLIGDEDRILSVAAQPGWRFKGHKRYTVQELRVTVRGVRYWRACWRAWRISGCRSRLARFPIC